MEDLGYITLRTILFQIISLILMFTFVKEPNDYMIYAIISVISSSGASILNIFYRRKYCKIKFTKNMEWKKHFRPILMLFVMILAQTIFNSSDITMLGLMKGDLEVGLYSTAVKISNLISQIVSSLVWVIMPRMSLYFSELNYECINNMLKKALSVLLIIGLPCAVGSICLAKEIILIIAGQEYISSAFTLCILMVSFLFSLVGGNFLGNMVLLPSKREDLYMKICCVSTLINIILNFFLIPLYGANAAAVTTVFAALLMLIILLITKDKKIKLNYIGSVAKSPIIGSFFIILFCILIKLLFSNLLIKTAICIIGSVVIYFVTLLLLKNELCIELLDLLQKKLKRG